MWVWVYSRWFLLLFGTRWFRRKVVAPLEKCERVRAPRQINHRDYLLSNAFCRCTACCVWYLNIRSLRRVGEAAVATSLRSVGWGGSQSRDWNRIRHNLSLVVSAGVPKRPVRAPYHNHQSVSGECAQFQSAAGQELDPVREQQLYNHPRGDSDQRQLR